MSDLLCAICNEPWDSYGARHGDMATWEYALFRKHAGCPSCAGISPVGLDTEEAVLAAGKRSIMRGTDDEVYDDNMIRLFDGALPRVTWVKPVDPVVWQCSGCDTRIVRDLEFPVDSEFGLVVESSGLSCSHNINGSYDDEAEMIDAIRHPGEPVGYTIGDGEYCAHCATTCAECSTPIFNSQYLDNGEIAYGDTYDAGASFADLRDPYHRGSICVDCLEAIPTCYNCGEPNSEDGSMECCGGRCSDTCSVSCEGKDCGDSCDGWKWDPEKYYSAGCYADGAGGMERSRYILADLVKAHGIDDEELDTALRGDMSDDDAETDEALEQINDLVPNGCDLYWEYVDGDLMLWDGADDA